MNLDKTLFDNMKLLTLRISFRAQKDGLLPAYLGSTLRGVLGHCMRDFCCEAPDLQCHLCEKRVTCSYAMCFCSPGNPGGAVNPFVLHVLADGKTGWVKGNTCIFDLTIIGKLVNHVNFYLDALIGMQEKGFGAARIPFSLEQIMNPVTGKLIWAGGNLWLRNAVPYIMDCSVMSAGSAALTFDTPTRILLQKKLCSRISFPILIESIWRRTSLLLQAYGDEPLEEINTELIDLAKTVRVVKENWIDIDFRRYSINRRDGKLELPGIEGWVLYEGELTPFTPILKMGHILHVGKNPTIGFGHFEIGYDR